MRKKQTKRTVILLSATLLFQTICEPLMAGNLKTVQAAAIEDIPVVESESTGATVSTRDEFMTALENKKSPITVSAAISIGDDADSTGKMKPVEIPAGTVIQGDTSVQDGTEVGLTCRGPIQLAGDGVIIKDMELTFESTDALDSVPHREIFLAGHSLTLDNVSTYLAGAGGSLGGLGGTEEELLPTVYAGGYEGTTIGENASLTVTNANSETMFQGIYMSHDAGTDAKVPYTGNASLNIGPKITVRDGIFTNLTAEGKSVQIEVTGAGNVSNIKFYGDDKTTLTAKQSALNRIALDGVGTVVLDEKTQFELIEGTLNNITLKNGAGLNLNGLTDVTVTGNFTGGAYVYDAESGEVQTDERGVLILNKEGSLAIQGTVSGTTIFHTDNYNFPGDYTSEKQYITAASVESGATGFELPESKAESYELKQENGGWTVYWIDIEYPTVGSVEILSAPEKVDINAIKGNGWIPAEEAPYCTIVWKDEEGNEISTELVEEMYLYDYYAAIGIKSEYWEDEGEEYLDKTDWTNEIYFVTVEDAPGKYYFYTYSSATVQTGRYTFLFCSEYCEEDLVTVADLKAIKDMVKAELTVEFYDSTGVTDPETTDIASEDITVEAIADQSYTGKEITPALTIKKAEETLVEGQNYKVTYENNIKAGTAKAIIEGIDTYSGTREETFCIVKSNPVLTFTINGESTAEAEYEQELSLVLQISPYIFDAEDEAGNVKFYYGDTLLGTSAVGENGQAVLKYQTTEQKLPIGESTICAQFEGTSNLNEGTEEAKIVLKKKTILSEDIASVSLKDFKGDGSTKTTDILSVTDKDGVAYTATGTAELPDAKAGAYDSAKIISWSLSGERADWYQLPAAPESILVSPKVNIIEESEPEPEPEKKEGLRILPIADQTYTGKAIKPAVEVYEGETLLSKKDYSVSYKYNVNAGTATVTVKGKGNYSGSDTTTFKINPKDISDSDVTVSDIYAFIKKGAVKNPKVTVKFGKKTLAASTETKEKDYRFDWPELEKDEAGNVIEQSHIITITGCGNYTGTKTITYDIIADSTKLMSKVKVTPDIKTVDYFNPQIPVFELTYGSGKSKITLDADTDYIMEYPEKIAVGKNTVTFTAKEGSGFYGTKTFSVTVKGKSISAKNITIEGIKKDYDFTGAEIRVGEDGLNTLIVKDSSRQSEEEAVVLKENVDYTLSYKKNINAGTATVTITGMGGYTGKKNVNFKINKIKLTDDLFEIGESAVYTKNGAKTTVAGKYKDLVLTEKKDYTVAYYNNKKLGENTATVKITGKGNYTGVVKTTYSVEASDKNNITFTVIDTPVPAKASKLKPKMNVVETGTNKKLTAGKDYEKKIEFYVADEDGGMKLLEDEDLKAGLVVTARLTVKNNSCYDPDTEDNEPITIDSTFRLYSVKASTFIIDKIPEQTYSGKEIKPEITVKLKDGTKLQEYDEETGTGDYIVTYSNNVKVGTAKVTITGVNKEFGGSKTVSFKIIKKPMKFSALAKELLRSWKIS